MSPITTMRLRKSTVTLLLVWLCGLVLVYVAHATLPERYYFDAGMIRVLIEDPGFEWAQAFRNAAAGWRLLGFGTLWPDELAIALGWTVAMGAIGWGVRMAQANWQPATFLLLVIWCVPVAIYHGQYSKELFAILAIAVILRISGSARGVVAAVVLALVFAALLRSYWGVIVVLWVVLLAAWRAGISWPWRLLLVMVAILPLSVASDEILGMRLSDGRAFFVENRDLDPDSATVFFNAFENTSIATDLANSAFGFMMLIAPVYLFKLGAAQHIAFAAFQLLNTMLFAVAARRVGGASGARAPDARQWRYAAATSWCIAFTIVQGMFEPDFGSFLRHQTSLVPMLAYVFLSAQFALPTLRRHAVVR